MPSLLDSANPQKINQEPLDFKMSKGSLLQPIHSVVIPNYDADLAAKYMNNPVFNTIDPNKGYIQMENDMAQGQSALEQWGRGVTKGVAGIPLKFLEGMGYVYGFGKWGLKDGFDVKDVDSFINNDFATYFKSLSEDVNKSLPIYSSFDYSQGNFLQKAKTAKFWANDAVEGLSFLASAYGGSFIGKGIGALGGEIASAVGASANAAAKVSKYAAYAGGTTYSVLMEGGMETKGLYDSVLPELEELEFQKLKEKNTDAFGNLMADEKFLMQEASKIAKEKAGQAAVNTFVGNIGILALSNSIEMKAFLGNPADDMRKLFRKTVKGEISADEISAWKEFGKGAVKGIVSEGLWEEGMQHAVESYQHKKALGKVNLNEGGFTGGYFKEWLKGWSTTEGQASMFLGALIGAPTQAIAGRNEAKEKQKTVKYFENVIDKEKESILASDKIYESFLKERELKDEKGKHVFDENGKITLNVDWMKDKAHQILLDEEYVNEKVDAVLRGDIPAATMVDQFYKSRKLWRYLASPLYANSDEAFDAFKKSFQTQADEHFAYSQQVASERQVTVEDPAITQNRLTAEKKEHDVQVQQALIEAQMMKNEFDNLQKNIKIDFFDPNAKAINEKLSKALFYEANKRKGLEKILADPSLSEENRTVITEMISASQELTNKLYNVKEREKYISTTTAVDEEIIAKQKEIQEIKNKYKEPIENSKNTKSTLEKIKDKGKEIVAPITSKMGINNSLKSEPAKKETPKKEVPLEEKISKEDKLKILKLNHDIERLFYQHGDSYLSRINKEYGGQSYLGKKHQYLKERGDIEIYKEKIKDQLQELQVQITELLESEELNQFDKLFQLQELVKSYSGLLAELSAKVIPINGGILNNFTEQDYQYVVNMREDLLNILKDWKKTIDLDEKTFKEDLSILLKYSTTFENYFLEEFLNNLNAYNEAYDNPQFDLGEFVYEPLFFFGPEIIKASAENNYFLTADDFKSIIQSILFGQIKIDISDRSSLINLVKSFIEENKVITQESIDAEGFLESKSEFITEALQEFDEVTGESFEDFSENLFEKHFNSFVELIGIELLQKRLDSFEKVIEESSKEFLDNIKDNIDQNKFLKNYSKDLENADDFYEHLYIEENPDYQVNYARSIVNKYKKDFFEKNQSELDKIEDLDTYHQILEALKNIDSILESKENDLKEFTKLSKKDIEHFIRVLENHIIPLAIKNQNNRKLVQEVSLNVRDENYFNQLGFNVQINHAGKPVLKSQSQELLKLLSEVLEKDVNSLVESNLIEKFNFLPLEQIIKELSNLPSEKKQKVLDFIKSQKENISEEIRVFENALNEARFKNSIHFDNYLVNPDATIEYIIYELSRYNDISYRTLEEKQNWFSSPLYNYSKHLSPALLLNELNKKKFSGSTALPYEKLVKLLENHLEYTALHNLEKNLNTTLDYTNYFKNLREVLEKSQLSPTYQQEIALREAFEWWNDKKMFLSYLKGVAGCLAYGTKVLMYDGSFKEVQNIKVGDQLMGPDSTPRTVLSTVVGKEQMYWIHQNKGQSYRVNESHILSTVHYKKGVVNLSVLDYLKNSKRKDYKGYKSSLINFDEKQLYIDPYYLGLWLGDGSKTSIKTITNIDKEIINYLKKFNYKKGSDLNHIIDSRFNQAFKNYYNLTNVSKLKEKYIPNDFLINSKENRLKLLAGLIDSDGYFSKKNNYYEINQKSEKLANQIVYLTRSLGFYTKIVKKYSKCKKCKNEFYPTFRITFVPEIEIPVLLNRKRYTGKSTFKNRLHTGLKIEKDIIDNYYGFLLDKDHLFLLEDFTVTHNTGKTSVFLKYFMDINKISYSNTIFSAHNESATNTLKQISDNAVALPIKELLSKSIDFFEKTNLIVLDEVNANDRTTFLTFLSFVQDINLKRDENNKLKVLFLGDPTQLKATQEQFIALFSKDYTKHAFPFRNYLKIFSPLTVAYRSDVGAINSASNVFRDTNQVITNYTANSSGKISDVNVKGTIVASGIRENGLLKDILQRLNLVKEQAFSKAVIVSTEEEVKAYQDYLTANNVQGVEVLTIENAQGRTFDEVHVDIIKNNLQSTALGKTYAKDFQYFYNTVLYTAISRAKNTVILFDESATFSQVENDDVLEVSKDLTKEKEELKQKMTEYLDIADEYYKNKIEIKPEEKKPEDPKPEEKPTPEEEEITEEEEEETDDLEEDVPEVVPGGTIPEEEPIIEGGAPEILDTEYTIVHELQNFQYEVLLEKQGVGNVKNKSDLQPGNEVVYVKSGDGNIYVYFKSENSPNYWTPLTLMYPKNLRESVESEKIIKDALDKNTNKNLIYSLNSIPLTHLSEKDIIARGTIKQSQKLKFHYSAVSDKAAVEKEIENSGGIMEYLKQKLLPLIYKKGSLELEEKATITNFEVFVPTENDKNVLTQMLKNDDPGAAIGVPYIKFDVVRIKENGQKSTKSFFVKMDAPMLHKTDSLIAPVKTFYDSITNLEKELAAIGLSSLKLGNDSFEKLVLAFKNDFTAEVESEKTLSNGKVVEHFKIVPKQNSIVTKEMVFEILKDYNLSDELTSKILAVFQKESKNLIPVLYTAKRKRLKVSPIEYVDFLHEQAALGNISAVDIADYEKLLEDSLTPTGDKIGDSFTEAVYNKREMSVLGTIRAIKSSGLQLEDFENNIRDTVRTIRRSLTEKSFVEIKQGPNKGKYFAFDPLIGRIVVMDKIGPKRFVSPKYAERENIGMTYYSDIQLTKQGGSAQTAFNILARSNDKVYTGEDPEDYFTLRMTRSSKDTGKMMIYAPTLIKENRSEDTFEKKYYYILKKAFDAHIDKLKEAGENYLFELTFKNEEGEDVSLQYNNDIDPKTGKTRWRNEAIIGKLRREYKLQDIELLEKLKALMVNLGVEIPSENRPVKASFELFNEMENNFYKEPMTSKMLSHVVGDQAFDEKTGRSKKYRTNVDKMFLKDSQENKSFEENPLVQSMVTTRFQKVTPSSIQVSLNKPSVEENSSKITEKETVSETGEVIINSSPEDGFVKTDPNDGTSSALQDFQPSFVVTKDYVEPLTDIIMEINEFEEDMRNAVQNDINLIIDFESPTFKKLAQSLSKTYGIEVDVLLNDMEGTFRKKICKG